MSNKQLTIVGVIAAVALILAVVVSKLDHHTVTGSSGQALLIQGLDPDMIHTIILGAGEEEVTLQRQGKQFVVTNKGNYPAQAKEIDDLVAACLDIQTAERITDNPDNHTDLEITEEKAQHLVKFLKRGEDDQGNELLSGLAVGKRSEQGNGTYVRLVNRDEVYLSTNVGWLKTSAMDYIDKKLTEITRGHIVKVTVTGPQGSYTIVKDSTGKAYLPEIPQGKKAKERDVGQTFAALSNLRFDDVQALSSAESDLDFNITYVCELQDSTVFTLQLAQKDDKTYAKCSADFLKKTNTIKEEDLANKQAMEDKEKLLLAQENAMKFHNRHQNWVYELAAWQAGNLTKSLSDLLEDMETQEPPEEAKENQPAEENP